MQQGMLCYYGNRLSIDNETNSSFSVPQTVQTSKTDIKVYSVELLANYRTIFNF